MPPKANSAGRRFWSTLRPFWPALPPHDLLRDATYRRLWTSILISSFGGQITMLALPLTAAVLLQATPSQMGILTAMELAPFVLLSLPTGVWLDRVRKLPVYVIGEGLIALILASVPLVWYLDRLSMSFLYGVAFAIGCVFVTAGTAAQIVLTQVVPRERLVEAHAKNALASSGAEVAGPGVAGALIKLVGAPLALLADALLLLGSVWILRGLRVRENRISSEETHFWRDLKEGMRFVADHRLLCPWPALLVCGKCATNVPWWCKFWLPPENWGSMNGRSACVTWAWDWARLWPAYWVTGYRVALDLVPVLSWVLRCVAWAGCSWRWHRWVSGVSPHLSSCYCVSAPVRC